MATTMPHYSRLTARQRVHVMRELNRRNGNQQGWAVDLSRAEYNALLDSVAVELYPATAV